VMTQTSAYPDAADRIVVSSRSGAFFRSAAARLWPWRLDRFDRHGRGSLSDVRAQFGHGAVLRRGRPLRPPR